MTWLGVTTVIVVGSLSISLHVIQWKAAWAEMQVARAYRAAHPDPDRRKKGIRSLAITIGTYAVIALGFVVGRQWAGMRAGALVAVSMTVLGVLGTAGFAIRAAWVPRQEQQR